MAGNLGAIYWLLNSGLFNCEEILSRIKDYVEIAKQVCFSSFHFQRIFHIICDSSIGKYIRSKRLSLAGADLVSGNEKVIP